MRNRLLDFVITPSLLPTMAAMILLVPSISLWAASTSANSELDPPVALRCSGLLDPLALLDPAPHFSWQLNASSEHLHGILQTAYQLQVEGITNGRATLLWDSQKTRSEQTLGIRYSGPALVPEHSYRWRVRAWDAHDHPAGWSRYATWSQAPEWHPQWIGADRTESAPLPLFRKSFRLDKSVRRALLYASGLGQDELDLNGRQIGDDALTPGWSDYRKTVFYDTYDITISLRRGQNALGVMLGNGMYHVAKTPGRYQKFEGVYGPLKCALLLHIEFVDGRSQDIVTDDTWKTAPGPITFSSTYGGEDYDARLDPRGWDMPDFDDSAWHSARVMDGPGGALIPEIAPAIRAMHTYDPVRKTRPKPGIVVYDLGQNFAGWPSILVAGPAGASVRLTPGELLNADGTVSQRSSGQPQWFRYTLRGGGAENWHPRFSYYGFRYVQVETSEKTTGAVHLLRLRGDAIHSSATPAGSFTSSDPELNRIHQLILRAIENNSESIFTDCPHREKLGWLEETHLMATSMLYDYNFARLFAATARNIADAQTSSGPNAGRVPTIAPEYVVFAPDYGVFDDSPEWGSAAILAPWYVYQRNGDLSALATQLPVMERYADYLATRAHDNIITYGLGDWYDIGPGPPGYEKLTSAGFTATAIDYQDLKVLERIAALLGMQDQSTHYARLAEAVRSAFNARFFSPAQHSYDKGSQTAQAMPLVLGLVDESERSAVLDALVADIRNHQNHVTAGDVGYHYVVDALLDGGRSDVLYDMLERTDTPSYGYQLSRGATSLTEAWDASPENSQDHFMLGDAEEWFYRGLGGINIDFSRTGSDRILFRPATVGKLAWVHTDAHTPLGLIESAWHRTPQTILYSFTVPTNTTATIEVNASPSDAVTVDGFAPGKAPGVLKSTLSNGHLQLVVGSGRYALSVHNPSPDQSAP